MTAAWSPQGAGQLLCGSAHSRLRTAACGVQPEGCMTTAVGWLLATVTPSQLWGKAESIKALQPGLRCNPALLQLVSRLSRGDYPQRVLCTGVGTGGSLAALAGLWAAVTYPAAQVRLITFGAPPVSRRVQAHERVAHFCCNQAEVPAVRDRSMCGSSSWPCMLGRPSAAAAVPPLRIGCSVCCKVVPLQRSLHRQPGGGSLRQFAAYSGLPTLALLSCRPRIFIIGCSLARCLPSHVRRPDGCWGATMHLQMQGASCSLALSQCCNLQPMAWSPNPV